MHKQVEFKNLSVYSFCYIENFINCYIKFLKSDSFNFWVHMYSHTSNSGSFPHLKSYVFFHRLSLLLIKLSGVVEPANQAAKRIITVRCSLCGTTSIQTGKSVHLGGEYNTIPASLMLRRQQKSQGEKFIELWPCKETTGEVAKFTLSHWEDNCQAQF